MHQESRQNISGWLENYIIHVLPIVFYLQVNFHSGTEAIYAFFRNGEHFDFKKSKEETRRREDRRITRGQLSRVDVEMIEQDDESDEIQSLTAKSPGPSGVKGEPILPVLHSKPEKKSQPLNPEAPAFVPDSQKVNMERTR